MTVLPITLPGYTNGTAAFRIAFRHITLYNVLTAFSVCDVTITNKAL